MELRITAEQEQLVDAVRNLLAKQSAPEHVRAAEPLGFDRSLWERFGELGAVAMAVPEEVGGWGASMVDLFLVAEQVGRHVAPVPLLEAQAAAHLLAALGTEASSSALAAALSGERLVTLAVAPASDGHLALVPAAAVADDAVVVDGDRILLVALEGHRRAVENLGSMPVADVDLAGAIAGGDVVELGTGPEALAAFECSLDAWLTLTAGALCGIGHRSLEIGVEYVKERKAWGVPIGTFQSIAHRLADSAAATDGARLLALEAAWAASANPARAPQLAAMAFAFAHEAARDASYRSLHYHGGYGFMLEYDIQLYWRRARAWANVFGGPDRVYERLGSLRYDATPPARPAAEPVHAAEGVDFRLGEASDSFRAEVRSFLDEFMTHEVEERLYRTGVSQDDAFTDALRQRGWLAPGWPAEWGGQGRDPLELLALGEEMQRVEAPTYAIGTTIMVAKMLLRVGTEEQKAEFLRRALNAEIIIVLGFSEPEAGSDVAAAQTRAVRDGEEWVINGQKMFTTNGHLADYAFLLTRTNTEVPKHKGLTTFLVPMKQEGVEVQAVYTLSGERTNITFYNDVRVPDRYRLGDVDGGWKVMTSSLQDEHSAGFGSRIARLVEDAEQWARAATDAGGRPRIDAPEIRRRLCRAAIEAEVSFLLQRRSAWMAEQGIVPEAEGPMAKLFSSEALERAAQDLTEAMGTDALRSYFDPTAPIGGRIEHSLRHSLGTTIYAGTSEVQRTIIAQRGLKLPR